MRQLEIEDFTFDDDGTVELDGIGTISGDAFDEIVAARQEAMAAEQTSSNSQSDAIAALKAEVDRLRREINTVNSRFHNFVQLHESVPGFCE